MSNSNREEMIKKIENLKNERPLLVLVNPEKPEESVIKSSIGDNKMAYIICLLFGILFIGFSVWNVIKGR
jgi:hypothetical protein